MTNFVIIFDTKGTLKKMLKLEPFTNYLAEYYIKEENHCLFITVPIEVQEKIAKLLKTHVDDEYIMVELSNYYTNSMYFKDMFIDQNPQLLLEKVNYYLKEGEALQTNLSTDKILDKISKTGIDSLTKQEKNFLENL